MVVAPLHELPGGGLLRGAGPLIQYYTGLKQDCTTSLTLPQAIHFMFIYRNYVISNLEYTCPIETFVPESIVTEIGDSPHEKAIIHLKGHLYIPSITFFFLSRSFFFATVARQA